MTTGIELAGEWVASSPFLRLLGARAEVVEEDRAVLALPFRDDLVTIGDQVHGGALSSLIDSAATVAAWATVEPPASLRGTTVDMNVAFVSGARGVDLVAEASVVRRGRSLVFVEVTARAADQVVAKGLVTYKLG